MSNLQPPQPRIPDEMLVDVDTPCFRIGEIK
jgi:hypothetical protein